MLNSQMPLVRFELVRRLTVKQNWRFWNETTHLLPIDLGHNRIARSPTLASAADIALEMPTGWSISGTAATPFTLGGNSAAFVIKQSTTAGTSSRVLQFRNYATTPNLVTTDLPGAIESIEYSSDGSRLLVNHKSPTFGTRGFRSSMLDDSGQLLWSQDVGYYARLSTNGQQVSIAAGVGLRSFGREINMFSASGEFVRRVFTHTDNPTKTDFILSALVVGNGDRAIIYTTNGLSCVSVTSEQATTLWRIPNTRPDQIEAERVYALDDTSVVQTLPTGFRVVRISDGAVLYTWDPARSRRWLATDRTPDFGRRRTVCGQNSGTVLLVNKTAVRSSWILPLARSLRCHWTSCCPGFRCIEIDQAARVLLSANSTDLSASTVDSGSKPRRETMRRKARDVAALKWLTTHDATPCASRETVPHVVVEP
jgi:hypothetical protein